MTYRAYRAPSQNADRNWQVFDVFEASFLFARGNHLVGLDGISEYGSGQRWTFIFRDSERFKADCDEFNHGGSVDVQRFVSAICHIQRMLRKNNVRV